MLADQMIPTLAHELPATKVASPRVANAICLRVLSIMLLPSWLSLVTDRVDFFQCELMWPGLRTQGAIIEFAPFTVVPFVVVGTGQSDCAVGSKY